MRYLVIPTFLLFGVLIVFISCNSSSSESLAEIEEEDRMKWDEIADLLMERMDLQDAERVLLVGSPGRFNPLYENLIKKLQQSKGSYLGFISSGSEIPEHWTLEFTRQYAELNGPEAIEHLKSVDLAIMLPGAQAHPIYGQIQQNLNEGIGRTIHFHWEGAYDPSMNVLEIDSIIDQVYQKSLLETDYEQLAMRQLEFSEAIQNASIRVTTPKGTDITFSVGDRPITRQDGDASKAKQTTSRNLIDREIELPAGAVRVAPIEESVMGVIAFPDAWWAGGRVTDLELTFEKGRVIKINASSGLEHAQKEINNAGEAGKSFREFVLGMNPTLIPPGKPGKWFPYYGYGAGVVRLSLGNNKELGGNVTGNYVRWNLFNDATVFVGEEVWVKDGELLSDY